MRRSRSIHSGPADNTDRRTGRRVRPAQQGVNTRGELVEGERLDDVVVGAGLQPGDPIADLIASRQDQDRSIDVEPAQASAQLDTRHSRQADVDDHHVGAATGNDRNRRFRIGHRRHVEAVHAQPSIDCHAHGVVVFDDQHASTVGRVHRHDALIAKRTLGRNHVHAPIVVGAGQS